MAICRFDLTTANIKNLFNKAVIDEDDTIDSNVKSSLQRIADDANIAEFADFLEKIGKEAQSLGLVCQMTEINSISAKVFCGHVPFEAKACGDMLRFEVFTSGCVAIHNLAVNQGTFDDSRWVKQTQAALDKYGAEKTWRGNNRRLEKFNFKISWLKSWLKKGAECTENIRLDEIAIRKRDKRNALRKEAMSCHIMPLADIIKERLPGVEVEFKSRSDDGSAWLFRLYNVAYLGRYGTVHTGLFMHKDAYVGWNDNEDFVWDGMRIDRLKDESIKLYTLFCALANSVGQVV